MSQGLNKDKICGCSSVLGSTCTFEDHVLARPASHSTRNSRGHQQPNLQCSTMHDGLSTNNLYSKRSNSLQTFPICFARIMPHGVPKGWINFSMSVSDHSSSGRSVIKTNPFWKQELYWYIRSFTHKMFPLRVCIYLLRHPQIALSFFTVLTARNSGRKSFFRTGNRITWTMEQLRCVLSSFQTIVMLLWLKSTIRRSLGYQVYHCILHEMFSWCGSGLLTQASSKKCYIIIN